MKSPLTIFIGLIAVALGAALFFIKSSDNAQIADLNASLTDSSNRLETASAQIVVRDAQLVSLSNNLAVASATASAVSNELIQAKIVLDEQKQLNQKSSAALEELNSLHEALTRAYTDATNQLAIVSLLQLTTKSNLEQKNAALQKLQSDYGVLGQRLREDVAARVVLERQWRCPAALQEQIGTLKRCPKTVVTPETIYAGLNVEVHSNGTVRVLSPD